MTRDRRVAGLRLTGVTALCPKDRHINFSLVLVKPRKTRPNVTERLLTGADKPKQTKIILLVKVHNARLSFTSHINCIVARWPD